MVAVESGSMEPHMEKGDLIYITGPDHFTASASSADGSVVTHQEAVKDDFRSLGGYGSVVVFKDPERTGPPIIHRARFHVDEGENWYDEANKSYVSADNCEELLNCPAPHSGYITKGDNNAKYDQASGIYPVVKPQWVDGTARVRVPYLGCIRLGIGENSCLRASLSTETSEWNCHVRNGRHALSTGAESSNTTLKIKRG
jgi:signal peptidase